jgi:hypothetical protein
MPATFCTEAELRANLQLGSLYLSATVEEVCQAGENIIKSYLWVNATNNSGHSNTTNTGTLYFDYDISKTFYIGQVVVISGNGSKHNGSKTLTEVGQNTITYAITGNNNTAAPLHPVNPYGTVTADTYVDYATVPEVRLSTLMVCTEIWQAKQAANGGALDPNFQPSPFKMGSTLIAKVRGLLANHLAPNGLIG